MRASNTGIAGFFGLALEAKGDERGWFNKLFNDELFAARLGRRVTLAESYLTFSKKDVLRGMHFQIPPADHVKIVVCLEGAVTDVALDLRRSSPTFGQARSLRLAASDGRFEAAALVKGLAHGFLATEDAKLLYLVETGYDADRDAGIAWDSFGFDWGIRKPILSGRDQKHPRLQDFASPFA